MSDKVKVNIELVNTRTQMNSMEIYSVQSVD